MLRTYAWLKLLRTDTDGQMDGQTLCDNKLARREPVIHLVFCLSYTVKNIDEIEHLT